MHQRKTKQFTLAAIDLDGTLLGPDLTISPANRTAIQRLQSSGAEVVLASGRHYDSLHPFAAQLPGVRWIVSAQGGEVSNVQRTEVLHRSFLEPSSVNAVLELGASLGFTAIGYAVDDVFSSATANPEIEFYEWLAGRAPVRVNQSILSAKELFKIVWVGQPEQMTTLRMLKSVQSLNLQSVQTHEKIIEFLPKEVTKASGLGILAKHLKLQATDAVVFGDAENDIAMFEWAGTSVAMPHSWPAAKAKASMTGPAGPKETALALAIEAVLPT